MATYNLGVNIELLGSFFSDGAPTDPVSVVCAIHDPTGLITSVPSFRIALGVYSATLRAGKPGLWYYKFSGFGAPAHGVGWSSFTVEAPPF